MRDLDIELKHDLFQDNLALRLRMNRNTIITGIVVDLFLIFCCGMWLVRGRYVAATIEFGLVVFNVWCMSRLWKSTKKLREIKAKEQRLYELCLEESEDNEDGTEA